MQMSSAKYKTLNAAASFAKLIALRRFAIGAVPLHGGRQQGGQRQGAAAALRGGSTLWRKGSACENGSRAAGQFTVPPLCFSVGMSCSCVMASHEEVGFVNILHAKAVCFFGT